MFPVLGFASLRGDKGIGDEPQHELTWQITVDMLDVIRVKWAFLSSNQHKSIWAIEES